GGFVSDGRRGRADQAPPTGGAERAPPLNGGVKTAAAVAGRMIARVQTWWTILRICIEERLVYRGDFWLGTLMRFLPIVTQIFLWSAVFAGMQATRASSSQSIAGYSYNDFVAYYLLTTISRAFSSMPGLAGGIALQI